MLLHQLLVLLTDVLSGYLFRIYHLLNFTINVIIFFNNLRISLMKNAFFTQSNLNILQINLFNIFVPN